MNVLILQSLEVEKTRHRHKCPKSKRNRQAVLPLFSCKKDSHKIGSSKIMTRLTVVKEKERVLKAWRHQQPELLRWSQVNVIVQWYHLKGKRTTFCFLFTDNPTFGNLAHFTPGVTESTPVGKVGKKVKTADMAKMSGFFPGQNSGTSRQEIHRMKTNRETNFFAPQNF